MIVIVDYNVGNIASIHNMLKKIGHSAIISSDPKEVLFADKIILPGVGSFDHGIQNINNNGLADIIREQANKGVPVLGICLGAQLMGNGSEEGILPGLELITMSVKKFDTSRLPSSCKIPHMGWNDIFIKKSNYLFTDMYPDPRFYFVHSYYFSNLITSDILATSFYGFEFASAFQHDNIIGVQFHPEKSHKYGMKLFENFMKM